MSTQSDIRNHDSDIRNHDDLNAYNLMQFQNALERWRSREPLEEAVCRGTCCGDVWSSDD